LVVGHWGKLARGLPSRYSKFRPAAWAGSPE
jgi:hypothetical protein